MKIKSDESSYVSYLSKKYPEEEFVLGRAVRSGIRNPSLMAWPTLFILEKQRCILHL